MLIGYHILIDLKAYVNHVVAVTASRFGRAVVPRFWSPRSVFLATFLQGALLSPRASPAVASLVPL